jgi:hypothetical protein
MGMALSAAVGGGALLVIATLLTFLLSHSGAGNDTECHRMCSLSRQEYLSLGMCRKETLQFWQERSLMSGRGKCQIDPKTGRQVCADHFRCTGGAKINLQMVDVSKSATYDCTQCDSESEGLRLQCCNTCQNQTCPTALAGNFKIGGDRIDTVVCKGCEANDLARIAKKQRNFCKDSPGSFDCSYDAKCKMGVPAQEILDHSYSCNCNSCNTCGDMDAQAQCCVDCLSLTCNGDGGSDQAKMVCSGCAVPELEAKFAREVENAAVLAATKANGGVDVTSRRL